MYRLYSLIFILSLFTSVVNATPKTYTAEFTIYRGNDRVGNMTKTLSEVNNNRYRLVSNSRAKLYFVRLRHSEDAIFDWRNDHAKPLSYIRTSDSSISSERKTVQTFDWQNMTETGTYKDRSWDIEMTDNAHSRITEIIQFQQMLKKANKPIQSIAFLVHDRGSAKNNTFQFEAEEILKTPAGELKTYRYRKNHANPKRHSFYWFAPELDFMPVRLHQFKEGEEQANMILSKITFL